MKNTLETWDIQLYLWIIVVEYGADIKNLLKIMRIEKLVRSEDIAIDIWKCFGESRIVWPTKFFES